MIKKWEENIWGKNNSYNFVCFNVPVILIVCSVIVKPLMNPQGRNTVYGYSFDSSI